MYSLPGLGWTLIMLDTKEIVRNKAVNKVIPGLTFMKHIIQ